ncbi:MAG TPA: acyl-CoA thioesterase [Pilimelia sp.]|nr:acyl-CoA thioesterase [Pilimelia sp.]
MTSTLARDTGQTTTVVLRPRYEGANIRTWIGFKHFMYLAEDAVLSWFRERGLGPHRLYHQHGVGLAVVDSSLLLPAVLEVDDEVHAEVTAGDRPGRFGVRLRVHRDGADRLVSRGKLTVALVREDGTPGTEPVPDELAPLVVDGVTGARAEPDAEPPGTPYEWSVRAPYFYCHFSDRLQHSAYVRLLEETVDRFLHARGISVPRMLRERGWIPVVSRAHVRLLADAHMDETVHIRLAVVDVFRATTYDARMDCHVVRDGRRVPVATARIQHGYARSRGPDAGQLASLDDGVVAALLGTAGSGGDAGRGREPS